MSQSVRKLLTRCVQGEGTDFVEKAGTDLKCMHLYNIAKEELTIDSGYLFLIEIKLGRNKYHNGIGRRKGKRLKRNSLS